MVGVSKGLAPVIPPGNQVKLLAPVATGLIPAPGQMEAEAGLIMMDGGDETFTFTAAVPVQPAAVAPVTVKICEPGGVTTITDPVAPVDQV
jgi:hypothetical protein